MSLIWRTLFNLLFGNEARKATKLVEKILQDNLTEPELEEEEKQLSTKIRSFCSHTGQEHRETLEDSAEGLLLLGVVYLRKAILQSGSQQKSSYIRCAVLLHAAIHRFKISKIPYKIELATRLCHEMNKNVLESCKADGQANVLEISEKIFKLVCEERVKIQKILETDLCRKEENDPNFGAQNRLSEISKTMKKVPFTELEKILLPDKAEKEQKITEKVREVNKNVTAFYKEIMHNITSECLKFLPSPPCKFSIVGLGSVAREEATLYSDFEHIILLEEGIDEKENYQSVLEYFRWFSVVFQVIVIGFGETIIPSVAVKSLNDSYSDDPGANWFYDNYTPNGISFDGMVPHACKIPIGRQQKTKKRSHTVELIKTPQKMTEYLTENERLKNGYHLDDVLKQTCFVCGDNGIYASFEKQRDHVLKEDTIETLQIYSGMISKNEVKYVSNLFRVGRMQLFNIKSYFYRPIVMYIAVLSRMLKIKGESSFDNLDILHRRGKLGPNMYNILKYAFAVACEVRMKLYQQENGQRHAIQHDYIAVLVGEQTVRKCMGVLLSLQSTMKHFLATKGVDGALEIVEKERVEYNPHDAIRGLLQFGYSEEIIKICENICQRTEQEDEEEKVTSTLAFMFACYCQYEDKCSNIEQRFEYFKKAEALYLKLAKKNAVDESLSKLMDFSMARFYIFMNKKQEGMVTFEKYFSKYFRDADEYDDPIFITACFTYYEMVRKNLSLEEANKKLKTVLWDKSEKLELQLLRRYHLAENELHNRVNNNRIVKCSSIPEISEEFLSISSDIVKNGRTILLPMYLQYWIVRIQIVIGHYEAAYKTSKAASCLNESRSYIALYKMEQKFVKGIKVMRDLLEKDGAKNDLKKIITKQILQLLWPESVS